MVEVGLQLVDRARITIGIVAAAVCLSACGSSIVSTSANPSNEVRKSCQLVPNLLNKNLSLLQMTNGISAALAVARRVPGESQGTPLHDSYVQFVYALTAQSHTWYQIRLQDIAHGAGTQSAYSALQRHPSLVQGLNSSEPTILATCQVIAGKP